MKNRTAFAAGAIAIVGLIALGGCSGLETTAPPKTRTEQQQESEQNFDARQPPQVTGQTEYDNYMKAQEMYDNPANILWCTASFPNTASPLFTVPIAGKLTSSSVSYYPNETFKRGDGGEYDQDFLVEAQSVDGMYHGSPAPYRYGFTPGGQYVDFTNLAVFCTTALTEFQRQSLTVSEVTPENDVTGEAEQKLKDGDNAGAQQLLDGISQ